ncbi:histidine kinase [Flagellimonas sp. 2504JD4-2]
MTKPCLHLLLLVVFGFGCHFSVKAQNTLDSEGKNLTFEVFKTSNQKLTIHDILDQEYPFKNSLDYSERTCPDDIFWIKLDFTNELDHLKKDSIWILTPPLFDYGTLYQNEGGSIIRTKFGWFEDIPFEGSMLHSPGVPFKRTALFQNKYIYLRVKSVVDLEKINGWKISYRSQFKNGLSKNFYNTANLKFVIPSFLFAGMCIIMFLMMMMFFVYSKRMEFLFYCTYVLCLFLYLLPYVSRLHVLFLPSFNLISYTFYQQMQMLINLSYVLFVMYYLNTKILYPKLHAVCKKIAWMLVIVTVLDVIFLLGKNFFGHIYLLHFQRLFMTLFGLIAMIYVLLKRKNHLASFIVGGSFCYMLGALGFLFFRNGYFMIIGSSLDILIFATGLTYKIQTEYKERLQFQREAHISKVKALRAQINPHFIFNSLNSIQNLVAQNDKTSALKYLSRFSRLTRNVLESSIETKIALVNEISMLNDYLELESLRFDNAFDYEIAVDPSLDVDTIGFPSMIIQPFVENAIIHGLLPKKDTDKKLSLSFKNENNHVLCEIEDNGVGRKAAGKKQNGYKNKRARGMQVTLQRIKALTHTEHKSAIKIIDKVDGNQNALGTKISIEIPI